VQLHEPLCQSDLFRTVQGRHVAGVDGGPDGVVNFGVPIAERIRADPHDGHVNQLASVQVPDPAALGPAEVGRPGVWKKHLRPLRQQHVAAGDDSFRSPPELLASPQTCPLIARDCFVEAEDFGFGSLKVQYFSPGEVDPWVEVLEDLLDDGEIFRLVNGPANGRKILIMGNSRLSKQVRLAQERRHVLSVVRLVRLRGRTHQRRALEDLDVQTIRVGWRGGVR
jgi:hypothetical protein